MCSKEGIPDKQFSYYGNNNQTHSRQFTITKSETSTSTFRYDYEVPQTAAPEQPKSQHLSMKYSACSIVCLLFAVALAFATLDSKLSSYSTYNQNNINSLNKTITAIMISNNMSFDAINNSLQTMNETILNSNTTLSPILKHYDITTTTTNYLQYVLNVPNIYAACIDDEPTTIYNPIRLAQLGWKYITNDYYGSYPSKNVIIQQDSPLSIQQCDGIKISNTNNNSFVFALSCAIYPHTIVYIHPDKHKIPVHFVPPNQFVIFGKLYQNDDWKRIKQRNFTINESVIYIDMEYKLPIKFIKVVVEPFLCTTYTYIYRFRVHGAHL